MTFAEMQTETLSIIQDDSYTDSVGGYINESFLQAAGQENLPDLKRLGIIITEVGQMYTSLRGVVGGFSGRLSAIIQASDSDEIAIFKNLEAMVQEIRDSQRVLTEEGAVEMIALEGHIIWYFPIPAAPQSIAAILFGNPPVLLNDEDVPLPFPDYVHRKIGVHGACYMIYDQIEDGIEGAKVNTTMHFNLMNKGITETKEWVAKNRVNSITSIMNV
jgi:hypothetical protein